MKIFKYYNQISLAFFVTCIALHASATNYYVDPSSTASTANGSISIQTGNRNT